MVNQSLCERASSSERRPRPFQSRASVHYFQLPLLDALDPRLKTLVILSTRCPQDYKLNT